MTRLYVLVLAVLTPKAQEHGLDEVLALPTPKGQQHGPVKCWHCQHPKANNMVRLSVSSANTQRPTTRFGEVLAVPTPKGQQHGPVKCWHC